MKMNIAWYAAAGMTIDFPFRRYCMDNMQREPSLHFQWNNDREVFDNGTVKIWRCATCRWWRSWSEERCCGCGAPRDKGTGVSAAPPARKPPLTASFERIRKPRIAPPPKVRSAT
jgi:hypothetical protein